MIAGDGFIKMPDLESAGDSVGDDDDLRMEEWEYEMSHRYEEWT
jgi:hypothetical protein